MNPLRRSQRRINMAFSYTNLNNDLQDSHHYLLKSHSLSHSFGVGMDRSMLGSLLKGSPANMRVSKAFKLQPTVSYEEIR